MSASESFECSVCCRSFKANFTLRRHIRQCHADTSLPSAQRGRKPKTDTGSTGVKCSVCGEILSNRKAMYYHRKRKHGSLAAANSLRHDRQKRHMEFETEPGEHDCVNTEVARLEVRSFFTEWTWYHNPTTVLRPFFREHPGEPVPEENVWSLWCKGRLTDADTPTIRLGATVPPLHPD